MLQTDSFTLFQPHGRPCIKTPMMSRNLFQNSSIYQSFLSTVMVGPISFCLIKPPLAVDLPFIRRQILALVKLKAFADDNINMAKIVHFCFKVKLTYITLIEKQVLTTFTNLCQLLL